MKTFKLLSEIGKSVIKKNVVIEGLYKADVDLDERNINMSEPRFILHTRKYKNIGVIPLSHYYLSDGESELEIVIIGKMIPDDNRIWEFKVIY